MPQSQAGTCSDCGGCNRSCPIPMAAPVVSLPPAQVSLPLRRVTGDEVCFHNAHLLVAACCGPFACEEFHRRFIRNRVTLIACPGDPDVDHAASLRAILTRNAILTLTVVRMDSGCCDGLESAAREALRFCGKFVPWQVVTLDAAGNCVD